MGSLTMKTITTALAVALTATSLAAPVAHAKGGDGGEGRAALKAEFAKQRAKDAGSSKETTQGGGFFSTLFGLEDAAKTDGDKTKGAASE